MASPFQQLAQQEYSQNPKSEMKNPYRSPFEQLSQEDKYKEGFGKSTARTASQIPQGLLEATPPGLAASLWQLLSMGEVLDPEEIEHIKSVSEREGIPFDENAYYEAAQQALGSVPTVANIAGGIEEKTGVPLEPKEWYQKLARLSSMASKLAPKPGTFRGLETGLPSPVLGTGVGATSQIAQKLGVPENIADIASFGILKGLPPGSPAISLGGKTKPSGLPERGFEKLTEPREVSAKKLSQINEKLESDFRDISDKIVAESPIGETAEALASDPAFKQQSRELLNQAQQIADTLPDTLPTKTLKKELADMAAKKVKGYALNEYDKSYMKFMKEAIEDIIPENASMGELVEQYRKNNSALSEYFEPGASKALNRAKRDALLDNNRAIANVMEKVNPELSGVFKEGNARWTKIMDSEAVDTFVNKIFEDKINFKKMHDFFDKQGYDRLFKRALGEKGFAQFEGLLKGMLSSETPYKMLKVAKQQGWQEMFETAGAFILHPTIGKAKLGYEAGKKGLRFLMNSLLDKPQLGITWKRGVDNLKKGNFAQAEKDFEVLKGEVLEAERKSESKAKEAETVEVTPEKVSEEQKLIGEKKNKTQKPKSFTTEKGSTYEINEDGSTTRNKAYRPEHGEKEQGIQEKSEKTFFVTPEDAEKLGEFQARGAADKRIVELPDGRLGVMYESGKDAGKIEARTLVNSKNNPEKGLIPVESWNGGKKVHFGNKIIELNEKPKLTFREVAKNIVEEKKKVEPKAKIEKQKKKTKLEVKPVYEMSFEEAERQLRDLHEFERSIIEPIVGKEIYEGQYKNRGFEGQRNFWDKYENLFSKEQIDKFEKYPYTSEELRARQNQFRDIKTAYNLGDTPQESLNEVIQEIRSALINPKKPENTAFIQDSFNFLVKKGHSKEEIAKEIFRVMKEHLSEGDVEYVLKDLFSGKRNAKPAFREVAKNIVEEKKKAEPKPKIEKQKKKTKLEILEDGLKKAEKHYAKRKEEYLDAVERNKPQKILNLRAKQWGAAKERLKDFNREIERLKEIEFENKKPKDDLTKEAIKEVKRQDISPKGLKAQKKFIIDKIADALKHPEKYHGEKIVFNVPGDGEFRIFNNPDALKKFEKHVVKNWPDKPLTDAAVKRFRGPH